jgi:hypothetical protein
MSYDLQICRESLDNHCSLAFGERGKGEGGRGRGKGKEGKVGKGGGGVAAGKEKSDIRVRKCCFYTFFLNRFGLVRFNQFKLF